MHTLHAFMEEDVFRGTHGAPEHWYSPLSNAFAGLNPFWIYARSIEDLTSQLRQKGSIDRVRIHSHGFDWGIRMGADDLRSESLTEDGIALNATVAQLLRELKRLGIRELMFDACHQLRSDLLRRISLALGEQVLVRGYGNIGYPFGRGDLAWRGGRTTSEA